MYRIVPDSATMQQVRRAAVEALDAYAEILGEDNSEGAVRRWVFGPGRTGQVVYLILDDRREIHLAVGAVAD